jgi:predicted helicase
MGKVFYADLWGLRKDKYRYLLENDVSTTEWQALEPVSPYFFFVPKDFDLLSEYERGWSVSDILPFYSSGVTTHRDHFVIDFDERSLRERIEIFRGTEFSDNEVRECFKLKDTGSWQLSSARRSIRLDKQWNQRFAQYLYRPFDIRTIYFSRDLLDRPRLEVMQHMLRPNLGLCVTRQLSSSKFQHVFVGASLIDRDPISLRTRERTYVFPLYLYTTPEDTEGTLFATEEVTREPNLSPEFIAAVEEKLGLKFVREGKGDLEATFGPEDILHYAYAVFHSPTYRERYAEFLKIDFPRLPLTSDQELFKALAEKGEELVSLHLMESPKLSQLITSFPVPGSGEVERVRYAEPRHEETSEVSKDLGGLTRGCVYINKTQYFEGIEPQVWEFQIGGYQVLHKWLKDRKGRKLSFDDLFHYQKIIVALKETTRLMGEIDELIPSWPVE